MPSLTERQIGDRLEDVNSLPPVGLLGLFQIKNFGTPPIPLRDMRFTMEVSQFYTRQLETIRTNFTAGAESALGTRPFGGAANSFKVPQGKGWLVTKATSWWAFSATQAAAGYIAYNEVGVDNAGGAGSTLTPLGPEAISGASKGSVGFAGRFVATTYPNWPIVLKPGTLLYFVTTAFAGTAQDPQDEIGYIEFPWS